MRAFRFVREIGAAFAFVACVPCFAAGWGPIGRTSIVTTAGHVVSRDLSFPLSQYESYLREGAELTEEEVLEIYPDAVLNPMRTIEEEIYLLQSIRSNRIDPHFAFRLGVLGQLVANAVAPMATASPPYRAEYFRDAEAHIRTAEMSATDRRYIDATYFPERTRAATTQDDTIEVDYRSGLGFRGLASASLSADASRCVNAVADVYYTVVIAPVSRLNVSQGDMRDYALQALEFYLTRGNPVEADAAISQVLSLGVVTPDLEKRIGDVYYDAEYFAKAMEHYEVVMAQDPTQKAVAERISDYYSKLGDEAAAAGFLEDSQAAYAKAASANAMNEDVHRKLFTAEREIEARDARLEAAKVAVEIGQEQETAAEKDKLAGNYVSALSYLREAESAYSSISGEFPDQFKDAQRMLRNVQLQMKELRTNLVGSVQRLSGTGYPYTARRLGRSVPGVEPQAFQALQSIELDTAMENLAEAIGRDIEALR